MRKNSLFFRICSLPLQKIKLQGIPKQMPDIIHLLPDSVANQIAAGEVIQRPASVIKELVENAVDAGSTEIKVLLKEAGKSLVQVTDNGCGMSDTDARMAFERHATSKIDKAEDLFSIRTLGFRGEALASITAIAQVEIKTRREEDEIGTRLLISGSRIEKQENISCPAGTNITVRNLFFNIPARRKFLKTNTTELRHLIIEFQRIALTLPDITFSMYHNGSEIYHLSSVGSLARRIAEIFGRGILPNLIPLRTDTSITKVSGYIGKPEFARKTYGEQFFFVNNRYMRHPYFHKAVTEAYQEILPPETIPSYFIYFEINPSDIDINIHPTKTEIKFEDERSIWQILHASVREALGKFNVVPSIDFNTEGVIDIPVLRKDTDVIPPEIPKDDSFNPFSDKPAHGNNFLSSGQPRPPDHWEKLYEGLKLNKQEKSFTENQPGQDSLSLEEEIAGPRLFHFKNRYILTSVKSGLMIIDQKRAHERILYEQFLNTKNLQSKAIQQHLFPETIKLNPADYTLLKELIDDLTVVGFDLSDLGNNAILINGYPSDLNITNPLSAIERLLEEYKTTQSDLKITHFEKVAASVANASAIPYGRELALTEMQDIVDRLFACSAPNYTPAGKQVLTILGLDEIEQRLK